MKRSEDYEAGYRDGFNYSQTPLDWSAVSEDYVDGWDDGNCDRPSMEELSLDVAKERRDPLGY